VNAALLAAAILALADEKLRERLLHLRISQSQSVLEHPDPTAG
jgi:phosphoribosylcarboxyaminoimidazole (NCAIR) mutase